jgi:hypothetical protein
VWFHWSNFRGRLSGIRKRIATIWIGNFKFL